MELTDGEARACGGQGQGQGQGFRDGNGYGGPDRMRGGAVRQAAPVRVGAPLPRVLAGPPGAAAQPAGPTESPLDVQIRARHEVLYFDAPPYLSVDNSTQLGQLAEGVAYRTVYGSEAVEYPGAMTRIDQCLEAGEQARVTARLPMKMMIVDREQAVLCAFTGDPLRPGEAVAVGRGPLLDGLIELFERVWAESVPFDPKGRFGGGGRGELNDEEVRFLALLLSGLTDDAVARHLGVARRTVLRRARSLMDRAGAHSRMQLGWYAAHHGWIEAPG